jgi:hypothetical protein
MVKVVMKDKRIYKAKKVTFVSEDQKRVNRWFSTWSYILVTDNENWCFRLNASDIESVSSKWSIWLAIFGFILALGFIEFFGEMVKFFITFTESSHPFKLSLLDCPTFFLGIISITVLGLLLGFIIMIIHSIKKSIEENC